MTISLAGQIVVVTGGARRLGRAIALECARAGADVAITYLTSHAEAEQTVRDLQSLAPDGRFSAFRAEVSSNSDVEALVKNVEDQFGGATALVNNAAIFERTPFESLDEAAFDAHIGANLKGPYLLSHRFAELFLRGGGGHIVNLADIHAFRPLASFVPYCVSKAGVVMLTQTMAKALAPRVRVNCICPGTILLPSQEQGAPEQGEADDEAALVARIPFGRTGTALEIAQTAVFLLGGPAFITGAILPVDGGESLR